MSQMAAEPASRSRENVFTRRIGPLPMWQWFLIALGMIGVYTIYQYRKKNAASASATNTAAGTSTGGTTGQGQVPQFVNQTYTYVAPPPAPVPGPAGPAGPAGPTGPAGPGGTGTPPPSPAPTPSSAPSVVPWPGPNLRGLTLAAATAAIKQAGYNVNNVSSGYKNLSPAQVQAAQQSRTVYSFTPYSNKTVNIGLM